MIDKPLLIQEFIPNLTHHLLRLFNISEYFIFLFFIKILHSDIVLNFFIRNEKFCKVNIRMMTFNLLHSINNGLTDDQI